MASNPKVTEYNNTSTKEIVKFMPDSAQDESRAQFLRSLFRALEEQKVRYCVMHSWENLPDKFMSDVDLAIHPKDVRKVPQVFLSLSQAGYQVIQFVCYALKSYRFDFIWFDSTGLISVGVDLTSGYVEGGLMLMSGSLLVADRQKYRGFWVASPKTELRYLLARRTLKESLRMEHIERLKELVESLGRFEAEVAAEELFGRPWKAQVIEACLSGNLEELLPLMKSRIWKMTLKRDPLNPLRHRLGDSLRLARRWCQLTGLFVVVLGPDGVGKSTLVGRLARAFHPAFYRHRMYHLRPMIIPKRRKTSGPVTNPHDEKPRGGLGSTAALCAMLVDYWLGYVFSIRPLLARTGLVVFDRYYQDVMVDPIRYRYGGPIWLARVLSYFVPPPDLFFLVLDADDEVILSRKSEVSQEELRRQRACYRRFSKSGQHAVLLSTNCSIEETTIGAARFLAEHLAERSRRRYTRWLS
jgi:thymidylate kinase